ncbi:DNA polymerase ligase N-terminal domain-containing protein [Kitasatospora sp. NPDC093550]|uniref:DNA polymerase ligase N-terminal domain-containing protein n=1 Tax=Kitasatospora sp. NPDC093550 TaxID=3364089 RepID=UPI003825137B
MKDKLTEYHRRRDFAKTAEPEGRPGERPSTRWPSFVVQIHDATAMHFDFRLEVDGVLKSWAVPKGPSHDPQDKRLAVPTEDHPLEYREFEGVIAAGEYGAGTVIVWDEGTYRNLSTDRSGRELAFADALAGGHASFRLHGHKLHGGYSLTRIRDGRGGEREAWLLVKRADTSAGAGGAPDPARARSVRSGHTLKQTGAGGAAPPRGRADEPSGDSR